MVQLLLISALLLSVPAFCTGQGPLNVSFQMNGVTGSAILTWQAFNLTATITLSESLGAGPVNVEIRPIWVDYDVDDKCSTAQLGAAIPGWTASVTFTTSTAVVSFPNVESLDSLEGYSILLYGSSKAVCASIESRQEHATAFAQFQNLVQGYVYFRQSMSNYTRIVTDLFSEQGSYNSSWFISNTFNSCSLITPGVQLKEFNPSNANGVNCSKTSQASCAAGQLSDKLGNVTIGGNKREARLGYTDKSLSSISDINGKLLLIKTSNGSFACAVIKAFSGHKALVEFSHEGVTGSVMFSQSSPLDPTTTVINITGLNNMASGYHVHVWPTPTKITDGQDLCGGIIVSGHYNPYNKIVTSPSYPSPDNSTDDMYELGDLSSKYGTMAQKTNMINTYTDYNLPLYGQNSIIGRSFVIHHNDSAGSRWICANIEPYSYPVVAAIAVFEFPVIGQIIFVQGQDQLETSIFAKLDYIDGRPGTTKNRWGINTNTVTNDMLSTTETSRCLSTGAVYNPHNVGQQMNQYTDYCSKNSPLGCKLGDMSGKLGILSIRNAANSDTSARQFFTDTNLPLFGPYSVIGRSVVIFNEMGTSILACANIKMLRDPLLTASFSMGGVSGTVSFSQTAGYGAKKTMVTNKLNGLQDKYRLFVYDLPPASGNTICSDLGNVFNPLNITQNASTTDTDDKFMVGDLSSNGIQTSWNRYNLPLTGLTSINKRSLVVVDQDSQ
uniref:Superoxide dismutase copper/zinc binding domain-containing protein n=1 Tax=Arion vulgaris TaxID=1028688 RepID=A0A0B7AD11_9EUPU